jgi:hypothetical protein
MAQLALAVGGGVIGGFFGVPQLGFLAGSLLGAFLFPNKPPAATEVPLSVSTWGQCIPVLYGTMRLPGNMIWAAPMQTKKSRGIGKGGMMGGAGSSSGPETTRSFAMAYCQGPVDNCIRMWADGKLIYDQTNQSQVVDHGINFYFHRGTEDELPEPLIQDWVKGAVPTAPFSTPAYRGLCYMVFPNFPLSKFGNRVPSITAEISNSAATVSPWVQLNLLNDPSALITHTSGPTAVDWIRGVVYSADIGGGGIRVINLNTNSEMRQSGPLPGTDVIACGQGGAIYGAAVGSNSGVLYRYDPNSLKTTSFFGFVSSSLTSTTTNFVSTRQITVQQVILATGTKEYVITSDLLGGIGVLSGFLMSYVYGDASQASYTTLPHEGNTVDFSLTCAGAVGQTSDVWIGNFNSFNGTTIALARMTLTASSGFDILSILTQSVDVTIERLFTPADFGLAPITGFSLDSIVYDQTDGTVILSAGGRSLKWDPASSSIVWTSSLGFHLNPGSRLLNGTLGFDNGGNSGTSFQLMDTRTGGLLFSGNATNHPSWINTPARAPIYDSATLSVTFADAGNNPFYRVYLNHGAASGYPLADIIQDIGSRCGLTSTQVDTTLITQNVAGYAITRNTTGKDVLAQLSQAYFFDVVESDYKLKFIPRGTASAATITQSDLGDAKQAGPGDYWKVTVGNSTETPVTVQVNFKDLDNDYLPNAGYWKRQNAPVPTVYSKQKMILDLPMAFHLSESTTIAQTWVVTMWEELTRYETSLGWQYLWLDPADNITVVLDSGSTFGARIMTVDTGADFSMQLKMVSEDAQTYTQATTIEDVVSPYAGVIRPTMFGQLFLLNAPLLRDQDDTGGASSRIYYGGGGFQQNWTGGVLYSSADNQNFTQFDLITNETMWGSAINALGDTTTPFSTDNVNTLTVALAVQGTDLSSASYLDWLNGSNAALVGNEVIQFQNATLNTDGTYTLSTLLRGRRGTEWATGTHQVGESFIILDTNLSESTIALSQINATTYWRLVPLGAFVDTTPTESQAFLGYDLKPYAPTRLTRAPSGSDLLVTWKRRTRVGGALLDGTGTVPLAEETESYDAYVLSAPYNASTANWATPASPVRSFIGLTSPQFTYTAAQMTADGFTPGTDALHIVVFQNSAAIGHGWPGAGNLPPF